MTILFASLEATSLLIYRRSWMADLFPNDWAWCPVCKVVQGGTPEHCVHCRGPVERMTAGRSAADIDGEYRYSLERSWDLQLPRTCWLMLNPSTADADTDDHTIRVVTAFSRAFGHGSFVVANLFAYRATDPKRLYTAADPIGPRNDEAILAAVSSADLVVAAWGNHGVFQERSRHVRVLLAQHGIALTALRITKSGEPSHPGRLPHALRPVPFEVATPIIEGLK
jgi:hypothetical protein